MKPAIEVKGLSKFYTINHKDRASYSTIKDDFTHLVTKPFEKKEDKTEKFWALKDINFEVNPGEIFGIVGRNGSGKSTLLKILSRIVEPTTGEIRLNGKVVSLLEVGTGFHPELTGRENVFFNGSMLGMSRNEIAKKFNEIVDFAEVEKFIDTPVKFYSSGMYVRLAFAVAAHLDPDILILDEVLSVGDSAFQQKSMQKIRSTMENGTTVLFVSHSMASVQQLCSKAIMLNAGKIQVSGTADEVTEQYNLMMKNSMPTKKLKHSWKNDGTVKNDYFIPSNIYIEDDNGKKITQDVTSDKGKWFVVEADVTKESDIYTMGYMIKNENRTLVYMSYASDYKNGSLSNLTKGKVVLRGEIPAYLLNEGKYTVSLVGGIYNKFWIFDPEDNNPSVEISIAGGLSESKYWKNARSGILAPNIEWKVN